MAKQLGVMLQAGIPLLDTLLEISRVNRNPALGRILRQIRHDLEAGSSLSQALAAHPWRLRSALRQPGLGGRGLWRVGWDLPQACPLTGNPGTGQEHDPERLPVSSRHPGRCRRGCGGHALLGSFRSLPGSLPASTLPLPAPTNFATGRESDDPRARSVILFLGLLTGAFIVHQIVVRESCTASIGPTASGLFPS